MVKDIHQPQQVMLLYVDRFQAQVTQMDELAQTLEQSSDAPDGFGKSIKITTTTPESSIASNETV